VVSHPPRSARISRLETRTKRALEWTSIGTKSGCRKRGKEHSARPTCPSSPGGSLPGAGERACVSAGAGIFCDWQIGCRILVLIVLPVRATVRLTFPRRTLNRGRTLLYRISLLWSLAGKLDGLLRVRNAYDLQGKLDHSTCTKVRQRTDVYLDLVARIVDSLYSINGAPTPSIKAPPKILQRSSVGQSRRTGKRSVHGSHRRR